MRLALSSYGEKRTERTERWERESNGGRKKGGYTENYAEKHWKKIPTRESIGALDLPRITRRGKEIERKI